jgi:hypothetical protein
MKICKELKKPNKRTNNPINKCVNELNKQLFREEIQMANKYMKKCSTFLAIKEMKIKTTLGFHLTGWNDYHEETTADAGEDVGEKEPLYSVGRKVTSTMELNIQFLQKA